MSNGTITIPADWETPNWCDPAPIGVTKEMLVRWLETHYPIAIVKSMSMRDIAQAVNAHYAPAACVIVPGVWPATWDVWAFVVKQEKLRRGGQRALPIFGEDYDT